MSDLTIKTNSSNYEVLTFNTTTAPSKELQEVAHMGDVARVIQSMELCTRATGSYVQLLPELSYLPAIIDVNNHPVFLYELIEVIDEYLDYNKIKEEFPTLSFSQINGAISFMRKLAQLNSRSVDIDGLEDDEDQELIEALRASLAGGSARVHADNK